MKCKNMLNEEREVLQRRVGDMDMKDVASKKYQTFYFRFNRVGVISFTIIYMDVGSQTLHDL